MSRTKAQKAVAKKLLTKPAGELLPIDLTTAKSGNYERLDQCISAEVK